MSNSKSSWHYEIVVTTDIADSPYDFGIAYRDIDAIILDDEEQMITFTGYGNVETIRAEVNRLRTVYDVHVEAWMMPEGLLAWLEEHTSPRLHLDELVHRIAMEVGKWLFGSA